MLKDFILFALVADLVISAIAAFNQAQAADDQERMTVFVSSFLLMAGYGAAGLFVIYMILKFIGMLIS
jgi:hypothetical protein